MMQQLIPAANGLFGTVTVPGDKSISHRALMIGSLAKGTSTFTHFLNSADTAATQEALIQLGVLIENDYATETVRVTGLNGPNFRQPQQHIDLQNSGTSTRLLLGLLAKQSFDITMTGDASLSRRPMDRIIQPLTKMGAHIMSNDEKLPLTIKANQVLTGFQDTVSVASAQVKSGIILAALQAREVSIITEIKPTRNHTELMLQQFGASLETKGLTIRVNPEPTLTAQKIQIPGDFSTASFFIAAALIQKQAKVILPSVGLNPTRTGLLSVLNQMKMNPSAIQFTNRNDSYEPTGTLTVVPSKLYGTVLGGDIIPNIIDELPLIALLATQAIGPTTIKDAGELRLKESDRLATITSELRKLGAEIEELSDGLVIQGEQKLALNDGSVLSSHGDHRIAMMLAVAGTILPESVVISDAKAVAVSYPGFFLELWKLVKEG